jgi:hypothetical protein
MGSIGVSSFQQVYGALAADALGPNFAYYDEWPAAASLLRPGLQHSPEVAKELLARSKRTEVVTARPTAQSELELAPWNMTDAMARKWVRSLRREVCHLRDPLENVEEGQRDSPGSLWVMRIQGNYQHIAYFRRYREFIRRCVLRSSSDFLATHFHPIVATAHGSTAHGSSLAFSAPRAATGLAAVRKGDESVARTSDLPPPAVPDLVVYLRLGDKAVAGDTLLTFESGYYDVVLRAKRKDHQRCWIVTVSSAELACV